MTWADRIWRPVSCTVQACMNRWLKGTVSRDFFLQVFCVNHLPPSPENSIRVISNFFPKFAEIFGSQGAPPVSMTPPVQFVAAWAKCAKTKPKLLTIFVSPWAYNGNICCCYSLACLKIVLHKTSVFTICSRMSLVVLFKATYEEVHRNYFQTMKYWQFKKIFIGLLKWI